MKTPEEFSELVRESLDLASREFRPRAFFDDRLDCIHVVALDCSVCEERVSAELTVLVANYPERADGGKYAGFTIKGVRHFCSKSSLASSTPIRIAELLDSILAKCPKPAAVFAVDLIASALAAKGVCRVPLVR